MGFSSTDDFISEVSANGKFWRADWMKIYTGGTAVAGRWYDFTMFGGTPSQYVHGNYAYNGDFIGGTSGWTIGSANWAYTAGTHVMTKTAGDTATVTQNTPCTNGVTYSVVYTLARTAGTMTVSLGGTNGTARSAAGTYRESISCGATANAPLTFTPDSAFAGTIDVIAVTRDLAFTPYTLSDTGIGREAAMWHGGDVSTDTKHLVNFGAWGNATATVPSVLMLVDMLGCYPRIVTNSSSVQTLNNTATLPRYTSGAGVRAFASLNTANGTGTPNIALSYTNQGGAASGRGLGATVTVTASAINSHIWHSGTAAGNYGPFLPLMSPDTGIQSVQTFQSSAASGSAGFVDLVLCKPIASLPITTAFVASERDLMNQLPSLPKIEDGACLAFLYFAGAVIASGSQIQGYCDFAWG